MRNEERYPVRCRECGNVIAVREGNTVTSSLRHRAKKKEVRVALVPYQKVIIVCERCGQSNTLTGTPD